jgi:tetratricopeptide (TPR) repeat protein
MARKLKDKPYESMRFADALALFAADFAAGNGDSALDVFKKAFYGRDQRQLGFYVLLAACGQNLDADHVDVMAEHPDEPLAQYLALHSSPLLRKHASQWAVASRQWPDGFLRHLALTHALMQRWQNDKVTLGLKAGRLPAIDSDFRHALLGGGKEADAWSELLRNTARQLLQEKHGPVVLQLAWQCWQLDDRPLANHLLAMAMENIPGKKDRLPMSLAGIAFLRETGQLAEADQVLQKLLADERLAARPDLWRLKAQLAEQRDQPPAALEALEKALETEFARLPEVIDLAAVRADYRKLLEHYQQLAEAMVTLKVRPPEDFLAKVVRAADRWRALDRDGSGACQAAGRILQTLGDRDLSWDYLTTPVGLRPNEADPWLDLARTLSRQGDLDLADRAYMAAFEAEPTNAQILWDRAQNLRQGGKTLAAHRLLQQLAEGKWQPRFEWLKTQARWEVRGR